MVRDKNNLEMKNPKPKSAKSKKTAKDAGDHLIILDNDDPIKPDDQLNLSPDELDEQYGNVLETKEPPKLQDRRIYCIQKKKFLPKVDRATFITIINLKSSLFGHDSAEAKIQTSNETCRPHEVIEIKEEESTNEALDEAEDGMDFEDNAAYENNIVESENTGEEFLFDEGEMDGDINGEMSAINEENVLSTIGDAADDDASEQEKESLGSQPVSEQTITSLPIKPYCAIIRLKNKFSFFDRSTGTKDIDTREMETQTLTTKRSQARMSVSLSGIYNLYCKDAAIKDAEKEKELKKKMAAHISKRKNADDDDKNDRSSYDQQMYDLLKIVKTAEKIISFSEKESIAQDFRYYEDQSDQFRDKGEGTLMMMWSMVYNKEKTLIVTDISWSPDYYDLFGITLSIPISTIIPDSKRSDVGYVCLWSLKNSSYPYAINKTHSGAICLSFNRHHGHIYVVGLRDGNLAVYNTSLQTDKPQYKTEIKDTKHTGCVRQVVWRDDFPTGEMNFYSVSDDGTVCQWILLQNEMVKVTKLLLNIDIYPELVLGGLKQTYNAIGTTITFNPKDHESFLVGTIEGYIFKCNTEWNTYVRRFRAHNMKINRIDFNKYDPKVYVSCSEDFAVKLWDDRLDVPLILINMNTSLSDVHWSPFSSTVFCVITENCRAIFYDLSVNIKTPVCNQLVQSPSKNYQLIRIAFDRRVPLIVFGCSKGTVISYKLSPNLRSIMKSPKKGIQVPTETLELEKLLAVLQDIRGKTN